MSFVYCVFVIHSLNYKEMPAFVKMVNDLGLEARFWRFRNWGSSEMCRNYEKYTVWDKKHKDYKSFLKVLKQLKNMKGYVFEEQFLRDLLDKVSTPWWVKLFRKF